MWWGWKYLFENINHSDFRSLLKNEKLSGNNFIDCLLDLSLVLRVEKKNAVIEQPLPPAPEDCAEPNIVVSGRSLYDAILKWLVYA
ncbi:hypothetical protein Tco_0549175 [Tanacetum coccineum]